MTKFWVSAAFAGAMALMAAPQAAYADCNNIPLNYPAGEVDFSRIATEAMLAAFKPPTANWEVKEVRVRHATTSKCKTGVGKENFSPARAEALTYVRYARKNTSQPEISYGVNIYINRVSPFSRKFKFNATTRLGTPSSSRTVVKLHNVVIDIVPLYDDHNDPVTTPIPADDLAEINALIDREYVDAMLAGSIPSTLEEAQQIRKTSEAALYPRAQGRNVRGKPSPAPTRRPSDVLPGVLRRFPGSPF